MTRSLALLFSFLLGGALATLCVRAPAHAAAQLPASAPGSHRWEQFCSYRTQSGAGSPQAMLKQTNDDLMNYGKQGWELVTGAGSGSVFVYCFRRSVE
ncbi:MAG TPA: hypothetical protein VKN99_12140 [Polyangia bacterium]|nr:hypothetical protein [Polyangia bacterium]